MLIFNEGVPGSGKSYDAVKTHVLTALAEGRAVHARINGLNFDAIAAHLKMDAEKVRELLHVLEPEDIAKLPETDIRDSLILIDEAHDFYPSSRQPMNPATLRFFAEHRHKGVDIVLMSQFYKQVHKDIRVRLERKYVFQKLSAIGMSGSYTVRQMATTEPDKWQQVDLQTRKYDPAIYPLYKSVQPGTKNVANYTAGATTAWRKVIQYSFVMVPLAAFALWFLWGFFTGDVKIVEQKKQPGVNAAQAASGNLPAKPGLTAAPTAKPKGVDTAGMPPPVAYLFEISAVARPRLSGLMVPESGRPAGVVEFHEGQGAIMERLTFKQLVAMGFKVQLYDYGVKLTHGESSMIATNWPIAAPVAPPPQQDQAVDRVRERGGLTGPAKPAVSSWPAAGISTPYKPPTSR